MRIRARMMGLRVTPELWALLAAKAEADGRTPSGLARFILEKAMGLRGDPRPRIEIGPRKRRTAKTRGKATKGE